MASNDNVTLGEFSAELTINGYSYIVLIRVVSDNLITHKFLIGTDFLNTVELYIKNGDISINPVKNVTTNDNELPEIFQINLESETDKIDVTHIPEEEHRLTLENIIDNYRPLKIREVGIKMTIVLKNEELVYQRARRLSPIEREKVNSM